MNNQAAIENSIKDLYNLAASRENARVRYGDYSKGADNYRYLTYDSGHAFEHILEAHDLHKSLNEQVIEASKNVFDMLPDSIQFGIKILGKPLILGAYFDKSYFLVVKPKEVKQGEVAPLGLEYDYNVEVVHKINN